ncbi:hypothetical protein Osc7112_1456 [Oscillatoria nigro-viridis PCC 7112]|uniref:Uncharacterized protein n=1 Tax=Phormidium nigroviride PCC 7112 TaxID=179408 RepID=K9VFF5_9CYAN|nr:hypothetical protein [Oscillatoria nigro-viridis]AFZ05980.1 hypothetical protein Osc7112_1456 [Oscillatoria nigro-viridis PCC 7112]
MTEPAISYRRIDKLRAIAFDRGFTNEDAKQFGKLSKTATWEALLELYLVDGESLDTVLDVPLDTVDIPLDITPEPLDPQAVDTVDIPLDTTPEPLDPQAVDTVDTLDWTNDGSFPVCGFTRQNSTSFLDWVDLGQLIALILASTGVFVLAMSMWGLLNKLGKIAIAINGQFKLGKT